jgi:hypothetical protein
MKKLYPLTLLLPILMLATPLFGQTFLPYKQLYPPAFQPMLPTAQGWVTDSADFNEDGLVDLIGAGDFFFQFNHYLYISKGNCASVFEQDIDSIIIPGDAPAYSIKVCDQNNDSHWDVIVAGDSTIYFYAGDGTGNLTLSQISIAQNITCDPDMVHFALADFNNDGVNDLYLQYQSVFTGVSPQSRLFYGSATGVFTDSQQSPPATNGPVYAEDLNSDGYPEIIQFTGNVVINNAGALSSNTSTGMMFPPAIQDMDWTVSRKSDGDPATEFYSFRDSIFYYGDLNVNTPPTPTSINVHALISTFLVGDFDGDSFDDDVAICTFSNVLFYVGNNNTLTYLKTIQTGNVYSRMMVLDVNKDGLDELFFPSNYTWWDNHGKFPVSNQSTIPVNGDIRSIQHGDFDQDGRQDIAYATNVVGNSLGILYGADCGFGSIIEYAGRIQYFQMKTGRFNNDSLTDIVISSTLYDTLYFYFNLGNRQFNGPVPFSSGHTAANVQPAIGDFNEDGYDDIFALSTSPVVYNIIVNDGTGNGTFSAPPTPLSAASISVYGADPELADFNQDGHLDVVITHDNALGLRMTILYGNGNGTISNLVSQSAGFASVYALPLNLNGDTYPDLISAEGLLGSKSFLLTRDTTNGVYLVSPFATTLTNTGSTLSGLDMNTDEFDDFMINTMNNTGFQSGVYAQLPDYSVSFRQMLPGSVGKGVGIDFNQDQIDDIVQYNQTNLVPYINQTPVNPIILRLGDTLQIDNPSAPLQIGNVQWYRNHVSISGANQNQLPFNSTGLYHVAVTYTTGAISTAFFFVSSLTGTSESTSDFMGIYPNPARNSFQLDCSELVAKHKTIHMSIIDMTGRTVLARTDITPLIQVDIATFASGLYSIRLYGPGFSTSKKLIKE